MIQAHVTKFIALACVLAFNPVTVRAETPLQRGTYLMHSIVACGNCHSPKGSDGNPVPGRELSGGEPIESPVFRAIPANITQDATTGIGKWSDAQIIDAIRNGRRPDGTLIGPPMAIPFYREMSDDDVTAIVAYLRQVTPIVNRVEKSAYKMPLPANYGPSVTHVAAISGDSVARGRYLATALGHCMECHTPRLKGENDMSRIGAGGNAFGLHDGAVVVSANLTPANHQGAASWSDEQLSAVIRTGVRPNGAKLSPPMAFNSYKNINARDMNDLVAFIRSLKPAQ